MFISSKHIECTVTGISLDAATAIGQARGPMSEQNKATKLSWPWWAPWALLSVAVTSLLTVGATLYDIL